MRSICSDAREREIESVRLPECCPVTWRTLGTYVHAGGGCIMCVALGEHALRTWLPCLPGVRWCVRWHWCDLGVRRVARMQPVLQYDYECTQIWYLHWWTKTDFIMTDLNRFLLLFIFVLFTVYEWICFHQIMKYTILKIEVEWFFFENYWLFVLLLQILKWTICAVKQIIIKNDIFLK